MEKKTSMEEWKKIAKQTRKTYARVLKLRMLLNSVPKTTQRRGCDKISAGIIQLYSDLEDQMFKEHPKEATTEIFYG